nr:hypothetical protein [Roseimaritima multifibrata]
MRDLTTFLNKACLLAMALGGFFGTNDRCVGADDSAAENTPAASESTKPDKETPPPTEEEAPQKDAAETEPTPVEQRGDLLLMMGAPGSPEYDSLFSEWGDRWSEVAEKANVSVTIVGRATAEGATDLERIETLLATYAESTEPAMPVWIVFIGHGTSSNGVTKFNLVGPDLEPKTLAKWLDAIQRPIVIINTASASGPFLTELSGENRTIVTATRSGDEQNLARFGEFISSALDDKKADLDHDDAVSVLELFLHASAKTNQFYEADGRLLTEHALLDDNGDKLGTPASFFEGTRLVSQPKSNALADGSRARYQVLLPSKSIPFDAKNEALRAKLEADLETIRAMKPELEIDEYYRQLESVFLQLAPLYRDQEKLSKADDAKGDDAKADDVKADDAKADDVKADDAKADDAKADDAKADDAKADDAKADDAKADDAKADDAKADDAKADDAKADDAKADDAKADDAKADDAKADDAKADDAKADDAKADDAKADDAKADDAKADDAKADDAKADDAKADDAKADDANADDAKADDAKADDAKADDAKADDDSATEN